MSNNLYLTNNHFHNTNEIKEDWNEFFDLISKGNKTKLLNFLQFKKEDLNFRDKRGRNGLFWAIYYKKYEVVRILLEKNINKEVSPGLLAINYAVYKNDVKLIKVLKNCGCDLNMHDQIASTPLIYAVLYNKLHSIDYLINNGACLSYEDHLGNSALSLAYDLRIEYLIEKFNKHLKKVNDI